MHLHSQSQSKGREAIVCLKVDYTLQIDNFRDFPFRTTPKHYHAIKNKLTTSKWLLRQQYHNNQRWIQN